MKYKIASKVIIFSILLALMFSAAGVTPTRAAGPFTHAEVAIMARDLLSDSELKTLLNNYRGSLLAGSVFPDWGYSVDLAHEGDVFEYYAEYAHWSQFTTAYLNYIRNTYSPPYSDQANKDIAFLLGIISHQVADTPFHNTFLGHAYAIDNPPGVIDIPFVVHIDGQHQVVEFGVDVFNMFDRGCLDYNWFIGCRYKWDNIDWYLPTDAIMSAYAEVYANGVTSHALTDTSWLTVGWSTFKGRATDMANAVSQGRLILEATLPNTHAQYYNYAVGGMTNMADLTKSKWEETWNILDYTGPYYVKPAASGTGDCLSWENACTLQTALNLPYYGSNDVWVMQGAYKPTDGADRTATFRIQYGKPVYGGFAGTETSRDQRNPGANVTILSGDIGVTGDASDNSYHVVTGASGAILDGFTITAGNANDAAQPNNMGGGMYNNAVSNATFSNLIFIGNSASGAGGGVDNHVSSPTFTNVSFIGNSADLGGGMFNWDCDIVTLTNVTFSGNTASSGGGIASHWSNLTVTNATFSGNTTETGSILNTWSTSAQINNTILWDLGTSEIFNTNGGTAVVSDSIVQGGYAGGTNIIVDDPKLGALGNYGGSTPTIPLLSGSPAIDMGDETYCPETDQRGITRPQGGGCDIGAYEAPVISAFTSSGMQDGWILESSETSNKGGSMNKGAATFNLGDDAAKKQYRSILSFNTNTLPDNAVIAKVTLKVKKAGVAGGGDPVKIFGGFMVDLKKGSFGTSALALGDFNTKPGKTLGAFKPAPSGGWYTINLTSGKAKINLTGLTQFRLRFKLDDNNDLIANFLKLYSGNAKVSARPQLIIEYYVP